MEGALADCERILPIWGQPANLMSSVVMWVVGVVLLYRLRDQRRWLGVALAAVGVGSALFHGPGGEFAGWAHDVSVAMVPITVGVVALSWAQIVHRLAETILAAFVVVVGLGALVISGTWLLALLVLAAVAAVAVALVRGAKVSWPHAGVALLVLGVGAVVETLSGTGAPWCNPDSLFQGHALWHLSVAASIPLFSRALGPRSDPAHLTAGNL